MSLKLQAFDHVHVYVRDRVAAESWCAKVLGLIRSKDLEFWAADGGPLTLENDTVTIHLALIERPAQPCRSTIALRVAGGEFATWRAHLARALPGTVTFEDHQASVSLYFADPDSNPCDITTYEVRAATSVIIHCAGQAPSRRRPLSSTLDVMNTLEVEIVAFAPEHTEGVFSVILPIQQSEFGIPITRAEQTDLADVPTFYRKGRGNFWVAFWQGQVVGTIGLLDIGGGVGALRKMFVSAAFRGPAHKTGQRLLDTLLSWAAQHGLRQVVLGTTVKFVAAHRFYEKNGFREVTLQELPPNFPRLAVDTKFYAKLLPSA